MNQNQVYNLCCRYHGKRVRIVDRDGRVHFGEVTRVTRNMVWIRPDGNLGGYGLGFFGFGTGFGFGFGIALGAIVGITLATAFFW
ncbi:hypothetical protein [Psychrobacillus sp. NPDC096623]|uniref:hypothetical protein n=1 Tax=Psychrobacillus sp. NPDC096623 TaxID=3364492 RepID=UPI0037F8FD9B